MRGGHNRLSQEEIDKINHLYNKYNQIKMVAIETGYDPRTIDKYLVKNNSKRNQLDHSRVITAYGINGTLDGTARIFNVSTTTIFRILKKNNIVVGNGSANSKRLYETLRARACRSRWRKNILARDNNKCVICGEDSNIVHHINRLSSIRDEVFKENPELNPFGSYGQLRKFSDLVMSKHKEEEGQVLCVRCHDTAHGRKERKGRRHS